MNDGVRKFQIIGAVTAIILVILFFVIRIVPMNIDYDLAKILSTTFSWIIRISAIALTASIADKLNIHPIGWVFIASFLQIISLYIISVLFSKYKKQSNEI